MRGNSNMTKEMELVDLLMKRGMFIMEISLTINLKEKEKLSNRIKYSIQENLKIIKKMVRD